MERILYFLQAYGSEVVQAVITVWNLPWEEVGRWRKELVEVMVYTCTLDTPLGAMTASAEEERLTGLWFLGQKHYPARTESWISIPYHSAFKVLRVWLNDYFSGRDCRSELRLDPRGTHFQKAVWDTLLRIPFGQTTSYGEIARELAIKRGLSSISARAVGFAVGHNPISILIPCHRVIGSRGSLTGYAGGLERKRALLQLEHVRALTS